MNTPQRHILGALLSLGLIFAAHSALAAEPDPLNAHYDEGKMSFTLQDGQAWYDQETGRQVLPLCRDKSSRTAQLHLPSIVTTPIPDAQCAPAFDEVFIDAKNSKVLSDGRGYTLFAHYFVIPCDERLKFSDHHGKKYEAIIRSEPGGSATFADLAVASEPDNGRQGSNLIALGDRIIVTWLDYEDGILSVSYLDRDENACHACEPTVRKVLKVKVQGSRLITLTPAQP